MRRKVKLTDWPLKMPRRLSKSARVCSAVIGLAVLYLAIVMSSEASAELVALDSDCAKRMDYSEAATDSAAVKRAKQLIGDTTTSRHAIDSTLNALRSEAESGGMEADFLYGVFLSDGKDAGDSDVIDALHFVERGASKGLVEAKFLALAIRVRQLPILTGTRCMGYSMNKIEYWARSILRVVPRTDPLYPETLSLLGQALMMENLLSDEGWEILKMAVEAGGSGAKDFLLDLPNQWVTAPEEDTQLPESFKNKVQSFIDTQGR
jgi:hypothetical protein